MTLHSESLQTPESTGDWFCIRSLCLRVTAGCTCLLQRFETMFQLPVKLFFGYTFSYGSSPSSVTVLNLPPKSLSMKKKLLLILLRIAAACAGAYWWYGRQQNSSQVHYLTETVVRGGLRKTVNATGEIDAVQLVTVGSQASGKIMKLDAVIGQKVKKGDPIAQIDPTTRQNDLDTARAMLNTYKAQLESRKIALKVAQTQ